MVEPVSLAVLRAKALANWGIQRTRSRSPERDRYHSRSRSRDRYRSSRRDRSPANGHHETRDYGSSYDRSSRAPPPPRSYEDRQVAKEQMMSNVQANSQQDRRVYVGNLAYEVKWHALKDFMKAGKFHHHFKTKHHMSLTHITAGDVLFADVLLLPNGMSKVIWCHG